MKDWSKLSIEELANLSDAEVEYYKKLIYAQEGIVFPEKPKEIDDIDIPKDLTVYYIQNVSSRWSGVVFSSLEDAKAVVDVLKKCKSLGHIERKTEDYFEKGAPKDYSNKPMDFTISAEEIYSKERYTEVQETLATYKKLREQYNKDKEVYEKAYSAAIEVTEDFTEKLNNAKETIRHREKMAYKFYCDYLPLADGNKEIAMNFLKKAYTITDEDVAYIEKHEADYTSDKAE